MERTAAVAQVADVGGLEAGQGDQRFHEAFRKAPGREGGGSGTCSGESGPGGLTVVRHVAHCKIVDVA